VNPELVVLHIPKTAGTSLHGAFRRYYGRDRVFWFGDDCPAETRRYPADLVGDRPVAGGHKPLSFYPGDIDPLFCAVLRDPVERAVSLFAYYTRPELAREEHGRMAREKILERLLAQGIEPGSMTRSIRQCRAFRREISNVQCAYLSRSRATFQAARDSLEGQDFVLGTLAHYGRFHDYLGDLLEWPLEQPGTQNRSRGDYAGEYLDDPELVALVRELNREDDRLLEWVTREHGGLYVNLRDERRRRERLARLPLKPWRHRRFGDWQEAAATLWEPRDKDNRLPWPVKKLMVARPCRLLYMPIPGPANACVNRFMLECSGIDAAEAALDLGLGRVVGQYRTGLMLADHDAAFAREVRLDRAYFKFAVVNEPVMRMVDVYATHFVADLRGGRNHFDNPHFRLLVAEAQGSSEPDFEAGISFRQFVAAIVRRQPRDQHVLWIPQYLHLKGVPHYDKLYREDQLEILAADLQRRCGRCFTLAPSAPVPGSAPAVAGAIEGMTGEFADTPAGELAGAPLGWRAGLVDEELRVLIMDYYAEDCRLYDLTASGPVEGAGL
jgi:hypothetical protein